MKSRPEPTHRFLRACYGLEVDRTPVWMMRQAGRYLPQYRAVREKVSFLELCHNPELACEVTLQPIDEFGFDAAILFSDILVPLPAMGLRVAFPEKGPVIENPVRTAADVEALRVPDPQLELAFVMDAVASIRKALDERAPLIGFCGAPFTLLTYAVEGGGSKEYAKTKQLLFGAPEVAHALLGKMAATCASYLAGQIAAGAQAVQIFDSWAGILSPPDFEEFALRWAQEVIAQVRASRAFADHPVPIIYFVNGCAPYLESYARSGADVLGVDWRIGLQQVRAAVGDKVALQGNLDPGALYLPPERLAERVRAILAAGARRGHIFNLGHGVQPHANPENVRVMVETVKRYPWPSAA